MSIHTPPMEPIAHPLRSRIHRAALELFARKGTPQVSISELAQTAGIARATIYRHAPSPEALFETLAAELVDEMHGRVLATLEPVTDPAQRLASGIRYVIRRAHDDPQWGRFMSGFAFSHRSLQRLLTEPTMRDALDGLERQGNRFGDEERPSAIALIAGTTVGSMVLVLEGHRAWRDAGVDAAAFVLRGLGVDPKDAKRYAAVELPPLSELAPGAHSAPDPSTEPRGVIDAAI